jgi:arsenical pump membrane protein
VAAAGAAVLAGIALARREAGPRDVVRAAGPGFLAFVAALGVVVHAAGEHGLQDAVAALVPAGDGLPALLAIAVLANLVNNLPATLVLVPVVAPAGEGPLLAALIGVNVGPNLTYVGSLATLLWRRTLHDRDAEPELGEFVRLGALTVPPALRVATTLLWVALGVMG